LKSRFQDPRSKIRDLRFEISNSEIEVAIIPLAQPLPIGSSDLPGSFERAALITLPYLVLHREEFAWPRMSPPAPVRSYIKPLRAAPFHPSPPPRILDLKFEIWNEAKAGLFSVALVVGRSSLKTRSRIWDCHRPPRR